MPIGPVYPPVPNVCYVAGSTRSSGDLKTGELAHIRGGGRIASLYSGAVAPTLTSAPGSVAGGSDVLFFSGAGRLNAVIIQSSIAPSLSGVGLQFYDSAVPTSGGPFSSSGHKLLFNALLAYGNSGQQGAFGPFGVINVDAPFQSGLCYNSKSGQPAFSVAYTPEVSAAFPNP